MEKQDYINQLDLMILNGQLSHDFFHGNYTGSFKAEEATNHEVKAMTWVKFLSKNDILSLAGKAYAKEAADDARHSI